MSSNECSTLVVLAWWRQKCKQGKIWTWLLGAWPQDFPTQSRYVGRSQVSPSIFYRTWKIESTHTPTQKLELLESANIIRLWITQRYLVTITPMYSQTEPQAGKDCTAYLLWRASTHFALNSVVMISGSPVAEDREYTNTGPLKMYNTSYIMSTWMQGR